MSAVLRESTQARIAAYQGSESYEAAAVRMRILSRDDYNRRRTIAHRLEREAAMLSRSMPRAAAEDAAYARRIRAEIAPPVDRAEQLRLQRWLRLATALDYARRAAGARKTARMIARSVRA